MPGILSILQAPAHGTPLLLRNKAMECAGLLIEAVGSASGVADATNILQGLLHAVVLILVCQLYTIL